MPGKLKHYSVKYCVGRLVDGNLRLNLDGDAVHEVHKRTVHAVNDLEAKRLHRRQVPTSWLCWVHEIKKNDPRYQEAPA